MRYFILLVITIVTIQNVKSQIYELGLFTGGSNLIGDVGSTNYISPNQIAFGGVFKWNRSPRHSFRASLIYTNLTGNDSDSDDPRRIERGYEFDVNLLELSVGMEFTFWDFNLHNGGFKGTPYLYSGISVARHDNYYFNNVGDYISENSSSWAFGIPMVLGYKLRITDQIVFGAEIGARYTFSDELDGSVPSAEERADLSFGNINSNDWYMFSGVTLTFFFGRQPCYCGF